MERVGAPGLPFTVQSGMTKPRLVPAGPGLEVQLCARRRRISHASSRLFVELGKLCSGARRAPGSPRESSAGSVRAWPPSPHFPPSPRRMMSFSSGRRGFRRSIAAPPHPLLPPPPPARGPQQGSAPPPPPLSGRLSPSPRACFFFFLFYFKAAAPAPFS